MLDPLAVVPCPTIAAPAGLHRLVEIAATNTDQSRVVGDLLFAWWNARACGGFGFTALWSVGPRIRDDMLVVFASRRPSIVQAHR